MTTQIVNPKSFVAGILVLILFVTTLFRGTNSHTSALHNFNLILTAAVSALCFWHAFKGKRPLIGQSEIYASIFLGMLCLIFAAAETFLVVRYRHKLFNLFNLVIPITACAGAVFYLREALREKRSNTAKNYR